jgi:hypothetical protein
MLVLRLLFISGSDLPDIEASAGNTGSASGRTVGEGDVRTASHLDSFCEQLIGHGRKVASRGVSYFLDGLRDVFRDLEVLLQSSHNGTPVLSDSSIPCVPWA